MPSRNAKTRSDGSAAPREAGSPKARKTPDVERFLTEENLKLHAGAGGYERGCDYAQHLQVVKLRRWRGRIEATVEGRDDYEVRLWDEGHRLGFSCTCPVGQRQQFCKHGVATALTWLRERKAFARERPAQRAVVRLPDVRAHLMTLDKTELVGRLFDEATRSGERLAEMKLEVAWRRPDGPDIPALKHAIRTWMWCGKDMHNNGIVPMAVPRAELMAHIIRGLLGQGRGDAALALLDCVFRTAPVSSQVLFNADGEGGYPDLLRSFQQLHRDACRKAKPAPDRLARDLIDYEVELDIGVFDGALKQYSGVLGRKGRRSYVEQIEDLARAVAPCEPKRAGYFEQGWQRHHRLFRLVERLDLGLPPEWYVDVLSRNQRWPDAPYILASKFAAAGKAEEAMDWVESGLRSAPGLADARLLGLAVDVCRAQGWLDRAANLVLREFRRRPNVKTFGMLRSVGIEAGRWPQLRRQAFRSARESVAQRGRRDGDLDFFGTRRDVSLLVEMHLAEGDVAAARRAARRGYCRDDAWVNLADALGEANPEAAATLYELRLRQLLLAPTSDDWQECDDLLRKLQACRAKAGQDDRFRDWVADVRMAHRENRDFCALLDRHGPN